MTDTACSLLDWANKYLNFSESKFDRKTFIGKRKAFRELFATKRGTGKKAVPVVRPEDPVDSLTPGKVLAILQAQYSRRSGNATNKDRKNLVAAWNWGMKYLGMSGPNPCRVETFPEERSPRYVPPMEDFFKVLAVADEQDKVMLLTFLHTGARRSEVFRLLWKDVDFDNNRVRLYTRKRRDGTLEYDWLPMCGELRASLLWWQANRTFREHENVFACECDSGFCDEQYGKPFKERMHFMRSLCAKAGVKPFGYHAIRHLTASTLYRMGQPISVIQAVLRHKSPNTTVNYLKSLGLEETRNALEDLSCYFRKSEHQRTAVKLSQARYGLAEERIPAERKGTSIPFPRAAARTAEG